MLDRTICGSITNTTLTRSESLDLSLEDGMPRLTSPAAESERLSDGADAVISSHRLVTLGISLDSDVATLSLDGEDIMR